MPKVTQPKAKTEAPRQPSKAVPNHNQLREHELDAVVGGTGCAGGAYPSESTLVVRK